MSKPIIVPHCVFCGDKTSEELKGERILGKDICKYCLGRLKDIFRR